MRYIDKLILHVTHNLFPLNEYSEGEIKRLMDKFQEEAYDLNINITEPQLKTYIQRFDQIKNSPKITEKDLRKYSLSKLIKLITSSKGAETPDDDEDQSPDIVYNEDGLIIYNGSKEDRCIRYGQGEKWCITRGSFGNYRYDDNRKNPTFYLVKDTRLPDSDRKSFFVVVVGNDNTYKVSDRSNNDVGGHGTEWDRWEGWSFVESNFPSIRGLRNIFKYIPLSNSEKLSHVYKNTALNIGEWAKLPYNTKEQYLVIRKGKLLFADITNSEFISKYLTKYPQISSFLSTNAGILDNLFLVQNLDKFSNQEIRSILSNMREKLPNEYLKLDSILFDVKKLLVKNDKFTNPESRLYITKDGNAIVELDIKGDIKVNIYTEDDSYENIKLNQRTSKYLTEYPDLDKIPFRNLIKLVSDGVIDKSLLNKVIENAKTEENSAIIVKQLENGTEILLDSNTFTAYKISDDKVEKTSFEDEEVQTLLKSEGDNTSFQENVLSIFQVGKNIPPSVDINGIKQLLGSIPYSKRIIGADVLLLTKNEEGGNGNILKLNANPGSHGFRAYYYNSDGVIAQTIVDKYGWEAYFEYLRNQNQFYNDMRLRGLLQINSYGIKQSKVDFIKSNPPLAPNSLYGVAMNGDTGLLINKMEPMNSFKISDTGKLVKANIPVSLSRRLLGQTGNTLGQGDNVQPAAGERRRGRPAGIANTPRVVPTIQPTANGNISVVEIFNEYGLLNAFNDMPRGANRRLNTNNATEISPQRSRGASRRNNQLGTRGNVRRVIEIGQSSIYIIRLSNGNHIASINIQPGNSNYLLTNQSSISLGSPTELLSALQQRGLAESIKGHAVRMFMAENPHMLGEVRDMLSKHINETKQK